MFNQQLRVAQTVRAYAKNGMNENSQKQEPPKVNNDVDPRNLEQKNSEMQM